MNNCKSDPKKRDQKERQSVLFNWHNNFGVKFEMNKGADQRAHYNMLPLPSSPIFNS